MVLSPEALEKNGALGSSSKSASVLTLFRSQDSSSLSCEEPEKFERNTPEIEAQKKAKKKKRLQLVVVEVKHIEPLLLLLGANLARGSSQKGKRSGSQG